MRIVGMAAPEAPRSNTIRFSLFTGSQAAGLQQGANVRILPVEIAELFERVNAEAAREHFLAQAVAVGASQSAVCLEPVLRIAGQHLAPDVGVIAGRVADGARE